MTYYLFWIALFFAILDWVAVAKEWRKGEYVFKPAVILTLLLWVWQVSGFQGPMLWIGVGLLFSLLGDMFLVLPEDQFTAGLISFLLAHISYILGLNYTPPPVNIASLILAVFAILPSIQLYRRIAASLQDSGNERLKIPILVYTIAITIMMYSALLTLVRPEWQMTAALSVSLGALLFTLSDTYLGWNKFVAPLSYGRQRTIVTYQLGQMLIVLGALLQYSR